MKGHISRSALCVFWLLACVTVTTVEGKSSLLSGSGLLRSSKYKEIRNIDSSVQAIRDKALFEKKGTKNSLIEKRYFNEGSLDSLEVDLPNNDEVIGFLFVKSNPYKDKVYGRYYSDLILAYSKTSLYLYDMAGALMSNLTLSRLGLTEAE